MAINRLKKDDIKYFEEMDPNGLLEKLSISGTIAFGVSKEVQGGAVAQGLLIMSEVFGNLTIGEALLIRAFECADKLGYSRLCAIISEEKLQANEMDFVLDYLEERLFCTQRLFFGEYIISVADMKKSPLLKKDLSIYLDLFSLEDARNAALKALIEMSEKKAFASLFPIRGMGKILDGSCSSVLVDDGEVYGAFILQNIADTYIMVLCFAEDEKSKEILFLKSMNEIVKTKNSNAELQILCPDRTLTELLEKNFSLNKSQTVLLTADIDEYRKLLDD